MKLLKEESVVEIQRATNPPVTEGSYPVVANYDDPLEIQKKIGRYVYTAHDLKSKHFQVEKSGKHEKVIKLLHFDRYITTDEVLKEMSEKGYRPADPYEFVAFGARYDTERQFPIMTVNASWKGLLGVRRKFLTLTRTDDDRRFLMMYSDRGNLKWDGFTRFATVLEDDLQRGNLSLPNSLHGNLSLS